MKNVLLKGIINDLARLEELVLTNEIDKKILTELIAQLKQLKKIVTEVKDVDKLTNIYENLKLPINSLLSL